MRHGPRVHIQGLSFDQSAYSQIRARALEVRKLQMTIRLFIGEKSSLCDAVIAVLPGAAEKVGAYRKIGDNYFVPLSGHVLQQAMPDAYLPDDVPVGKTGKKKWRKQDLPIVPTNWILEEREDTQRNLYAVRDLLPKCDEVINLGDPDEEGQLLVMEVLHYFKNTKPVKRLLINDYNETKVREALANIRDNNEPLFQGWYRWALARSHYDWLFGLNITRAATIRAQELGYNGVLTVGSVQTPTLKIVVDRDRVIENFVPIPFFGLVAHLQHVKGPFRANWKPKADQPGLDEASRLIDKSIADSLTGKLTGKPAAIAAYSKEEKKEVAPLPLSLNELTMDAVKAYGYSGDQVLEAAQTLYETYKVTSYPRSDNRYLSEAQHGDAPEILAALKKNLPDMAALIGKANAAQKSRAFNDKKMEGTPHHGIVPTKAVKDLSQLTPMERNIYQMIVRSYLAQFYPPAISMQTEIELAIDGETFTASGKTPVSPGWREIYAPPEDEKPADDDDDKQTMPAMSKGDQVQCTKCERKDKKTTAPARFDEGTLLAAMIDLHKYVTDPAAKARLKEGEGIGTPATRANIIKDLRERGFLIPVKGSKTKFMSSKDARGLIDALPGPVKDPTMAGIFKLALDAIAKGTLSYEQFIQRSVAFITKSVKDMENAAMTLPVLPGVPCPKCNGGTLHLKKGGSGAFWSCSNWNAEPKCEARFNDLGGKPQLQAPPDIPCPKCDTGKLRMAQKKSAGKPAGKAVPGKKPAASGFYWYCTNYKAEPKCDAMFGDNYGRPKIPAATTGTTQA